MGPSNRSILRRSWRVKCGLTSKLGQTDELKSGQTFYRDKFAAFRPSNALSAPLARALACNALVEISAPWNLAKDKQQEKLLDAVLDPSR